MNVLKRTLFIFVFLFLILIFKKNIWCQEFITTANLNLREKPTTKSKILVTISKDVIIKSCGNEKLNWVKIKYNKKTGYVYRNYIKLKNKNKNIFSQVQVYACENNDINNNKSNEIIDYAKKYIGTCYKYGGTSLTNGCDCSGFVYSVMKNFNINLNRTSSLQSLNGTLIDRSQLQAGDLVFFSYCGSKNIHHVGIYIGENNFIHSSSVNKKGVTISSLSEKYYSNNYITARRII
ncbi:MAG: C40 family peptidase [Clostridiales bacterium]|jgi:hypothetical protein|nr:C40 family peptidase [Clostridiales bacterium]